MALRVARGLSTPNVLDFIPLSKDFDLVQVAPPKEFLNKSLAELNLRAKYNVQIIAIKELTTQNMALAPAADFVVKNSDLLLMLGKSEDIDKIKALK